MRLDTICLDDSLQSQNLLSFAFVQAELEFCHLQQRYLANESRNNLHLINLGKMLCLLDVIHQCCSNIYGDATLLSYAIY